MAGKKGTDAVLRELRAFGLSYPGTHLKSPWPDHLDLAVNNKTFAYLSREGEPFGISCKLPHSGSSALKLPYTQPTEYGLGKSGWVSAQFSASRKPPVKLLKAWIDESYRAQAPKRLIAQLDASSDGSAVSGGAAARKTKVLRADRPRGGSVRARRASKVK